MNKEMITRNWLNLKITQVHALDSLYYIKNHLRLGFH